MSLIQHVPFTPDLAEYLQALERADSAAAIGHAAESARLFQARQLARHLGENHFEELARAYLAERAKA